MPINYQTYVSSVEEKQLIQTLFPHTLSHLQFLSATQFFNLAEMATQQENSALSNVSDTMCQRLSVNDWKMDMATKQEKSSLGNASETMCQRRLSVNDWTMDMATKKQEKSSLSNASETMCQRLSVNDCTMDMATKKQDKSSLSNASETMCQRLSVNDCTMDMATKKQEKSSLSNASETMCQRLSVNDCTMDMATKKQEKSSLSNASETMCQRLNVNDCTMGMATKNQEKSSLGNASETMCQRLSVNDWTMDMATKKQDKSSLSNASETMCQRSSVNDWMVDMATKLEKADPSNDSGSGSCLYELLCSDTPSWNYHRDRRATGLPERMESFLRQSGNRSCADCGSPDPKWVSLSLGVLICIKCSGVHRNLGVHISKVLSLKLDDWTEEQVDTFVTMGGNIEANKKYEACIPVNLKKPKPDSSIDERFEFIRRKYELLQFLNSDEQMSCPFVPTHKRSSSGTSGANSAQDKKQYEKQQTRHRIGNAFRNSWGRKESEHKASKKSSSLAGMVEFVGLIMVNVVKGTNLAVRDMMSSDPYVILALGNQSVKTRVIKNNLNPVWNESLMLSIPQHIPPLKVIVYDKDTFTTDDFMGEAEIDIQPLVTAAKAYEKSTINESMQLGKWVASKENTLVKDGIISLVDGKVRQDISLRLQNVERGVLEIELECVPLTQ